MAAILALQSLESTEEVLDAVPCSSTFSFSHC